MRIVLGLFFLFQYMKQISSQKQPFKFICTNCDFKSSKKCNYDAHLLTRKHKMKQNETKNQRNLAQYICNQCNVEFKSRTSLWRHKSKPCRSAALDENTLRSLVEQNNVIIQQNGLYQKQVMDLTDVIRESSGNNIVINSTQTHNKNNNNHVSINVFLNEQCKDAINFEDFINQIQVTRDDIVNNAEVGFIDGMCDIVTNNLDKIPLQIRPIHCTDLKRKTLYMRNNDTWTKDNNVIDQNMNRALRKLSSGSIFTLNNWKNENTDYNDGSSDFSNKCVYIMKSSMVISGGDDPGKKVLNKIACNVKYDGNK